MYIYRRLSFKPNSNEVEPKGGYRKVRGAAWIHYNQKAKQKKAKQTERRKTNVFPFISCIIHVCSRILFDGKTVLANSWIIWNLKSVEHTCTRILCMHLLCFMFCIQFSSVSPTESKKPLFSVLLFGFVFFLSAFYSENVHTNTLEQTYTDFCFVITLWMYIKAYARITFSCVKLKIWIMWWCVRMSYVDTLWVSVCVCEREREHTYHRFCAHNHSQSFSQRWWILPLTYTKQLCIGIFNIN